MKKMPSLALFLLVTLCFPLYASTENNQFVLTSFDDLTEAYNLHHQAESLTREEQRQNLATIQELIGNWSQLITACNQSHQAYWNQLSTKTAFENMMYEKAQNIRHSWMIRDYAVGAAVVGTFVTPIIAAYELFQSEWTNAALCGVAAVACLFAWGKGVDYTEKARSSKTQDIKKELEVIEQELTPILEKLEEQNKKDQQALGAAYEELTSIKPLSKEAQSLLEFATKRH